MFYKKWNKIINNPSGFTLLEVLIAMVIMTFGFLATIAMQMTAMHGNMQAKEMNEAANVALVNFENLLAQDFDNIRLTDPDGDGTFTYPTTDSDGNGIADYPECTLDTEGRITDGGKLVNAEGLEDPDGKFIICYKILSNDSNPAALATYEQPGGGTLTTTIETHVAWHSSSGCKDDDETDTEGCARTHPTLNAKFNNERVLKNIIPYINR